MTWHVDDVKIYSMPTWIILDMSTLRLATTVSDKMKPRLELDSYNWLALHHVWDCEVQPRSPPPIAGVTKSEMHGHGSCDRGCTLWQPLFCQHLHLDNKIIFLIIFRVNVHLTLTWQIGGSLSATT